MRVILNLKSWSQRFLESELLRGCGSWGGCLERRLDEGRKSKIKTLLTGVIKKKKCFIIQLPT